MLPVRGDDSSCMSPGERASYQCTKERLLNPGKRYYNLRADQDQTENDSIDPYQKFIHPKPLILITQFVLRRRAG